MMNIEDIQVDPTTGAFSAEKLSAIAKAIRGAMPVASVTVGVASTDPNLTEADAAKKKIELDSAAPVCPPLDGKSEAEVKKIVEAHGRDRDAYMQRLLDRPTGTPMTRSEGSAMAGEILAALRNDGHRV
jgi:hypothetical protein